MITVSIVDDEKELRQSITTFVNGSPGFKCLSAYSSAAAALKGLPVDRPDVVLMDINLGTMNGIECVERLTAEVPTMQILMLTVYEDTDQDFQGAGGRRQRLSAQAEQPDEIAPSHPGSSRRRFTDDQLHRAKGGGVISEETSGRKAVQFVATGRSGLEMPGPGIDLQTNRRPVGNQH